MILGKIVGDIWSTKKNDKIHALRFLLVQRMDKNLKPVGDVIISADEIGAGVGELVIVTQGAPAMQAFDRDGYIPIDAVVVGIVDSFQVGDDSA